MSFVAVHESVHGTKRTCRDGLFIVRFRREADMPRMGRSFDRSRMTIVLADGSRGTGVRKYLAEIARTANSTTCGLEFSAFS
jgi:hypothetical protein